MKVRIDKKIILLVLTLTALYVLGYKPLKAREQQSAEALNQKVLFIEECLSASDGLPSKAALDKLKAQQARLIKEYRRQADYMFYAPLNMNLLPQDENKWPLYFRKVLFQTTAELRGYARDKKISIPAQLGLPSDLPEKQDVVKLLIQLGLVRELIMISAQAGAEQVLLVSPLIKIEKPKQPQENNTPQKDIQPAAKEEQDLEAVTAKAQQQAQKQEPGQKIELSLISNYAFIEECPLLLKVSLDTKSLYRLLYQFQKKGQFYLIRNMQVRTDPQNSSRLIADLLVSKLWEKQVQPPKQEKEEAVILSERERNGIDILLSKKP